MNDPYRVATHVADGISAVAIIGTILGYLPAFAALAAIIWYAVQIWESKTVQKYVRLHRRHKRRVRERALAEAKRKVAELERDLGNPE